MTAAPTVSILICSYNYERFVGETIRSALAQVGTDVEVIVVDDGSTDGSWPLIEAFGTRIRAIRQPNGGQGAAYNACFAASRGEWVIWLDCDDLLDPHCLQRCLQAASSGVHKVAFAMRVIDAQGQATGNVIPYTLHEGDVRGTLRRYGHYGGPPGSGNLYRRSAVAPYFPLNEARWPMCADTVPFVVAAALGPVAAVHEPLGSYRIHKPANQALGLFGNVLGSLVETLVLDDRRRQRAMRLVAGRVGWRHTDPLQPTPTQMRTRIISWKLARQQHPYPGDSGWQLLCLTWQSLRHWPGWSWSARLALMAWAVALLLAPLKLAAGLVRLNASDKVKRRLRLLTAADPQRR